ncbi:MAG: GspE/PulE family protein [Planctomycetota bacterium]
MLNASDFLIRTLVEEGSLQSDDAARNAERAAEAGADRIDLLIDDGLVHPGVIARTRAKICEYPFCDLDAFDIETRNAMLIPKAVAERFDIFPLFETEGVVTLGMIDPLDLEAIDRARSTLHHDVDPVVCDQIALRKLIDRAYGLVSTGEGRSSIDSDEDLTTGSEPIVAAVNQIIAGGIEAGASDVHINPDESEVHLRYRVDGMLVPQPGPAKDGHAGIVQRLKVLARLDLAQTRRPQDGKFRFVHQGSPVDIRLSLIPTIHGENVVMRLLRPAGEIGTIEDLGMPIEVASTFGRLVSSPHGMLLVTGPTGSGKTTTLYTALNHLNDPARNIITIEDPVEIRLPLVRQVQVNSEVGLTFLAALRSILRQDPDVILLGEIRDDETARISTQAALTGHVVLSTLHTNDAPGAVARLRDFGLPGFALTSAVLGVVAQRLVRRVCSGCCEAHEVDPQALLHAGHSVDEVHGFAHGAGCPACLGTGYKGRAGVYEMFEITPAIKTLIEKDEPVARIREAATAEGYVPLWHHALELAKAGITSFDEYARLRTAAGSISASTGSARGAAA